MKKIALIYKAVLAGIFINIAATIFLSVENKVVGALLFTFGLFGVLVTKSNLYTGMAGYFPERKWWELIVVFIGNGMGCAVYSLGYSLTTSHEKIYDRVYQLCEAKFSAGIIGIFVMSISCVGEVSAKYVCDIKVIVDGRGKFSRGSSFKKDDRIIVKR